MGKTGFREGGLAALVLGGGGLYLWRGVGASRLPFFPTLGLEQALAEVESASGHVQ